ncbi:MAG: 30S ribosomal protein S4 [Thermoplasmatales archaeon]|jgi:small subunit ribosomal protein S4|nr:30S ribosomal protein S4 [Candidatus Thermoplasmatota archaeon]MCL6002439.1 30S ribosomal protein S4 [Candidatus Thermoplasmatota archaeon]MDA8054789.1 30S ribosomal protein S4 [Thermoplasmatales archaeon]
MGDPKKIKKKYETPRHPFEGERIKAENQIVGAYGLKNKRELWKAESELRKYRTNARDIQASLRLGDARAVEQIKSMIGRLSRYGILSENATTDDILALNIQSFLERRLQTLVMRKGLARTPGMARQLIVHGHISIGDRKVTIPGYKVLKMEEESVSYAPNSPLANELHPMRIVGEKREGQAGPSVDKKEES